MSDRPAEYGDTTRHHLEFHLHEMEAWASGSKSWINQYHHTLSADQIAVLDTQEVVRHSACVQAYAALLGEAHSVSSAGGSAEKRP